jgi:hypothetical protein
MPRLILAAAAVLIVPFTLALGDPRPQPPLHDRPVAAAHPAPPDRAAARSSGDDHRKLVAAALLVALEWGRR